MLRFDADAAPDAKAFRFHPNQTVAENGDGSLTVRFKAGGIEEICWQLVTWGESVTVGARQPLPAAGRDVRFARRVKSRG